MVFVYFAYDFNGLEAAAAVATRRQKRRNVSIFSGRLCEKDRLRSVKHKQTCLI